MHYELAQGYEVTTIEDALETADIFVTTTGNKDIITAEHISKMKDQAIVCNIGHFDNEIQVAELENMPGVTKEIIKDDSVPGGPVSRFTFADGKSIYLLAEGRLINLGCATGHPSFVMSNSFTNQTIAQIDIRNNRDREIGVTRLSKELDEEVARLHLDKLGAKLTTLSSEQADYIGVPVDGPYKPGALQILNFSKNFFRKGSPLLDCLFFDTLTMTIFHNIHFHNVF